jgi:multidrug efflux system membrane fusion protein
VLKLREDETPAATGGFWTFVRRRGLLLLIIAVLLLGVIFTVRGLQHRNATDQRGFGRGGGHGAAMGGMGAPVSVGIGNVTKGDIQVRIPALGTITPLATVTVRTQVNGQLVKIGFTEGQVVHQGDFLAQIDPRTYEAALKQAEGNLRRDQALLADARLNLKRYQELVTEDSIAQQQVDTQRASVDQYEGIVEADQAQVNTASVNLAYTHIVSPVTGRVGLRQVDVGNYVTPGDTNGIVVITQLEPITAIFAVPEDQVTEIMRRLQSGATLPVEAYDRSNSTKLATGKLLTLDNQIDTSTGTVKLRAQFDNKDGLLFPNQFVNIQLYVNVLKDQIVMPNAAVHRGAPNGVVSTFVYLVNKGDHTVSVRPVTLGTLDGERISVLKGVAPGDVVVTEGGDRLRDGATVMLPGEDPAAVAGVGAGPGAAPGQAGSAPGAGAHKWQGKHGQRGQHRQSQQGGSSQSPPRQQ